MLSILSAHRRPCRAPSGARARWAAALGLWGLAQAACGSPPAACNLAAACSPNAIGLHITELMVDPAGHDRGGEWIELTNTGTQPVGLDRLELSVGATAAPQRAMLQGLGVLAPQHTVVLGDGTPGEAPIDVSYGALELPNAGGHVALRCRGALVAAVCYGAQPQDGAQADAAVCAQPEAELAPTPRAGFSLVRQVPHAQPVRWAHADGPPYDAHNCGSPGAANADGPQCRHAAGVWRPIVRPAGARVRLAAVLADPIGPDMGREWLAVRVHPAAPMDLVGLVVQAHVPGRLPRRWQLEGPACAHTAGGSAVVLRVVGLQGPLPPQPLPPDQQLLWGPTLPNAAMQLALGLPNDAGDIDWSDVVHLPKASVGVPWVREPACIVTGCSEGAAAAAWPEPYFGLATQPGS